MTNPFDHRTVEKVLFATYRDRLPPGRRTRTFLRKMSRNIRHAWEIGNRDGAAGKPEVPPAEVPGTGGNQLERDMYQRAYAAYQSGYRAGKEG